MSKLTTKSESRIPGKAPVIAVTASLALTLFIFGASSAGAQQAEEDTAYTLEEVIVTAQKREQNVQDVGISITALDTEALYKAGIDDISRMYLVTPGMTYGFYGADAKIAVLIDSHAF